MGNNSSRPPSHHGGHYPNPHQPVAWTQSFPRDYKRLPKVSANKVLPPPPSSAKLRPTENGRSLQSVGTITERRRADYRDEPRSLPGYVHPCLAHPEGPPSHLSASMTHLHQPPPCALHDYPSKMNGMRFGAPPSKIYTSEPDLRSNGSSTLPLPSRTPHTIIDQSPTKGRIKSKKKNKAPPPPEAFSDGGEKGVHWFSGENSYSSRPPSQASKKKSGGGMYRKKNDSRRSDAESSYIEDGRSGRIHYLKPEESPASSRDVRDRRGRSQSIDCLQHELRAEREEDRSYDRDHMRDYKRTSYDSEIRVKDITDMRKDHRMSKRAVERKQSSTTTLERRAVRSSIDNSEENSLHMLSRPLIRNSEKRVEKTSLNKVFDDWETAEKEMIERKRRSEDMKNELQNAAKNLRKVEKIEKVEVSTDAISIEEDEGGDTPKTFFFGMEPAKGIKQESKEDDIIVIKKQKSKIVSENIDEFLVSVNKQKPENSSPNLLHINYQRKEDGGYHSRQNSGSYPSEADNVEITANLRPVLPKRHREIPRFSPNAAWKLLGDEQFLSEDNLNESRSSDEIIYEDKIRGYSRPIAPPRGSGEKSADSGISGDAGSPGPMPEFDRLVVQEDVVDGSNMRWRGVVNGGPLAASSPVVPTDFRRTWTPAEDLDDNSLDGSTELTLEQPEPKASAPPPKLTTRTSMFDIFPQKETNSIPSSETVQIKKNTSKTNIFGILNNDYSVSSSPNKLNGQMNGELSDRGTTSVHTADEFTQTSDANIRKLRRSVSSGVHRLEPTTNMRNSEDELEESKWRDNWSLSNPGQITVNITSTADGSEKATSDIGSGAPYRRLLSEPNHSQSSYALNNGHIMYLPNYNSQLTSPGMVKSTSNMSSSTSGSGDTVMKITSRELNASRPVRREDSVQLPSVPRWGKKNKKFSYQSTVRVLEKKKLEQVLDREIAEKERRRLEEAAAMKQVEKEFEMKREKEKKRKMLSNADEGVQMVADKQEDFKSGVRNENPRGEMYPIEVHVTHLPHSSPRFEAITSSKQRNGHVSHQESPEHQIMQREIKKNNKNMSGDNYRRGFSKGQMSNVERSNWSARDGEYSSNIVENTSVVRNVRGPMFYDHPQATGNMGTPLRKMERMNGGGQVFTAHT